MPAADRLLDEYHGCPAQHARAEGDVRAFGYGFNDWTATRVGVEPHSAKSSEEESRGQYHVPSVARQIGSCIGGGVHVQE